MMAIKTHLYSAYGLYTNYLFDSSLRQMVIPIFQLQKLKLLKELRQPKSYSQQVAELTLNFGSSEVDSHDFCAFSTLSLYPIAFLYCIGRRVCEEQTTSTLPDTKPAGAAYIGGEAVAVVTLGNSCLVPRHPLLQGHYLLEV